MKVDSRSRWHYRIQSGVFLLLFLVLLVLVAWLSTRYSLTLDLSNNQRNSLSTESSRMLEAVDKPLKITLFVSPLNERRVLLETLFQRYQRLQDKIDFRSLNPDLYPELLRQHDIRYDGEVLIEYGGQSEKLSQVDESAVSNAIQRLLRQGDRWLVFLQGHGEPSPFGDANHDYSQLATRLASNGFRIETLNLMQSGDIPDNTSVLVLASPRVELLPGEIERLQDFIEAGGNLLWLADPQQFTGGLALIADQIGVSFLPGIVVDPGSRLMGLDRIDFALVGEYPRHPVTLNLASMSLFPQALAIDFFGDDSWQQQVFLQSAPRSWNETGDMRKALARGDNADEVSGPFTLGMTLARSLQSDAGKLQEQRIAVVGDADFLSNRYLGNGSNQDIGLNLLNWLSHDDQLIAISPRPAPDTQLDLSPLQQLLIAITFLLLLPLGLIACGLVIWLKRRKR